MPPEGQPQPEEEELARLEAWIRDGRIPRVQVAKAGHHGSRNGVTPALVRAAAPVTHSTTSCGERCALIARASQVTPKSSSIFAAGFIVSQSEVEPMTMPTIGFIRASSR